MLVNWPPLVANRVVRVKLAGLDHAQSRRAIHNANREAMGLLETSRHLKDPVTFHLFSSRGLLIWTQTEHRVDLNPENAEADLLPTYMAVEDGKGRMTYARIEAHE